MSGKNLASIASSLVVISLAITLSTATFSFAADSAGTSQAAASSASSSPAKTKAPKKTVKQRVKSALKKISPQRLARDREYKKASALFPAFCKDWERKLHDRELNNQAHIAWALKDGWETGSYVGYSPVKKCECHQSTDGYSIGKVGYDEFNYYLTGKTTDEAKHATPKVTETTNTTELFRWDQDKWFY